MDLKPLNVKIVVHLYKIEGEHQVLWASQLENRLNQVTKEKLKPYLPV